MDRFIKLIDSRETEDLMQDPNSFILLTLIAKRARREAGCVIHNGAQIFLGPGEALLRDYKKFGLTERQYRTSKTHLESAGQATFRTTNRGTIAKLIKSTIYDINIKENDEQVTSGTTDKRRTSDEQATTNKNSKKEKNNIYLPLSEFLKEKIIQSGTSGIIKTGQLENWSNDFRLMFEQDGRTEEQIKAMIEAVFKDSFWSKNIRSAGTLREQWNAGKLDRLKNDTVFGSEESEFQPQYHRKLV